MENFDLIDVYTLLQKIEPDTWVNCAGSIIGDVYYTSERTQEQLDSLTAHELAKYYLKNDIKSKDINCKEEDDPDMVEAVKCYVGNVQALSGMQEKKEVDKVIRLFFSEQLLDRIDYFAVTKGGELHIHEFRYDMKEAYAYENKKLIIFALSAMSINNIVSGITKIRIFLHQPRLRGEHVNQWELTPLQLVEQYSIVCQAIERAVNAFKNSASVEKKDYVVGRHCINCDHYSSKLDLCETLVDTVVGLGTAQMDLLNSSSSGTQSIESEDIDFVKMIELEPLIIGVFKAVKAQAISLIKDGKSIDRLKIVEESCGKRAWYDPEAAEDTLKTMKVRIEDRYEKTLISPTKAQKILSPQRWKKIQTLIKPPTPRPRLVLDSDPRPSITHKVEDIH